MMTKCTGLAIVSAAICLTLSSAWPQAIQGLPEPDYDAIETAAQQIAAERDYRSELPARLAECTATAAPYANSPRTGDMVTSKVIRMTCLRAMLRRLADLYYTPDAFGPGGIDARIDEIAQPLYRIYFALYNYGAHNVGNEKVPYCIDSPCGSIAEQLAPRDDYVEFLLNLTRYVAGYAHGTSDEKRAWIGAWENAAEFSQ